MTSAAGWLGPVVAILVLQTMASVLTRIVPTVGPAMLLDNGWAESWVGYLAAAMTAGSMLVLLLGTQAIQRAGSIRAMQISLLIGTASLALLFYPSLALAVIASAALGFSHGVATPAGSDVLQRFTPPRRRNLMFSIKQAGVPLGGVLAGSTLPAIVDRTDWQTALVVAGIAVIICVVAVAPLRGHADKTDKEIASTLSASSGCFWQALLRPIMSLSSEPTLWRLGWAGALLATAQSCWLAFSVTYLVTQIGISLTTAGLLFALMQTTGVIGRIGLGWISDRIGSAVPTMRVAAIASAATTAALALTTPAWPIWALAVLAAMAGSAVSGWSGVQIAEIAERSPPSVVRETAAGSTILIFLSNILAPASFTLVVTATGRFDIAFYGIALMNLLSLALITHARKPEA